MRSGTGAHGGSEKSLTLYTNDNMGHKRLATGDGQPCSYIDMYPDKVPDLVPMRSGPATFFISILGVSSVSVCMLPAARCLLLWSVLL